jgi:hypothetical protein
MNLANDSVVKLNTRNSFRVISIRTLVWLMCCLTFLGQNRSVCSIVKGYVKCSMILIEVDVIMNRGKMWTWLETFLISLPVDWSGLRPAHSWSNAWRALNSGLGGLQSRIGRGGEEKCQSWRKYKARDLFGSLVCVSNELLASCVEFTFNFKWEKFTSYRKLNKLKL